MSSASLPVQPSRMFPVVPVAAVQVVPVSTVMPSAVMPSLTAAEMSGVLAGQQPVGALDEGDLGAESPEHLGELAADVASADDEQM